MTALPVATAIPRGWDDLVALGPITGRTDARCWICGAPAVAATLRRWLCASHPPQAGEWGHSLDWTPNPIRSCAPNRCYCARCPTFQLVGHHASDPDPTRARVTDDLAARRAARTLREGR